MENNILIFKVDILDFISRVLSPRVLILWGGPAKST